MKLMTDWAARNVPSSSFQGLIEGGQRIGKGVGKLAKVTSSRLALTAVLAIGL